MRQRFGFCISFVFTVIWIMEMEVTADLCIYCIFIEHFPWHSYQLRTLLITGLMKNPRFTQFLVASFPSVQRKVKARHCKLLGKKIGDMHLEHLL